MANHFLLKLPKGHAVLSMSSTAAMDMLRQDALTSPHFSYKGTVAEFRELCAGLIWMKSSRRTPGRLQLMMMNLCNRCNVCRSCR